MKRLELPAVLLCSCSLVFAHDAQESHWAVTVSVANGTAVFGCDTRVFVRYENTGREPSTLPDPLGSSDVILCRQHVGVRKQPIRDAFAPLRPLGLRDRDGTSIEAVIHEVRRGDPITLKSGGTHDFDVSMEPHWTGNIRPGRWAIWIEDGNIAVKSTVVEMSLMFSRDSIAACREAAGDVKQPMPKRRWHAEYLKRIMPDLDLTRWQRGAGSLSDEE